MDKYKSATFYNSVLNNIGIEDRGEVKIRLKLLWQLDKLNIFYWIIENEREMTKVNWSRLRWWDDTEIDLRKNFGGEMLNAADRVKIAGIYMRQ